MTGRLRRRGDLQQGQPQRRGRRRHGTTLPFGDGSGTDGLANRSARPHCVITITSSGGIRTMGRSTTTATGCRPLQQAWPCSRPRSSPRRHRPRPVTATDRSARRRRQDRQGHDAQPLSRRQHHAADQGGPVSVGENPATPTTPAAGRAGERHRHHPRHRRRDRLLGPGEAARLRAGHRAAGPRRPAGGGDVADRHDGRPAGRGLPGAQRGDRRLRLPEDAAAGGPGPGRAATRRSTSTGSPTSRRRRTRARSRTRPT